MAKSKLLLVDDNLEFLKSLTLFLESEGFQVQSCISSKEALNVLQNPENVPELIISDILMEDVDGITFFREVMENPFLNHLPFIFVTGVSNPQLIQWAKSIGVDDVLTKPIEMKELLAVIEGKLKRFRLQIKDHQLLKDILARTSNNSKNEASGKPTDCILFYAVWNSITGPKIESFYPSDEVDFSLNPVISHLFQGFKKIHDEEEGEESYDLLIRIPSIEQKCFSLFVALDPATKNHEMMLVGVIAPNINYLQSNSLKNALWELSKEILSEKENIEFESHWKEVRKCLTTKIKIDLKNLT